MRRTWTVCAWAGLFATLAGGCGNGPPTSYGECNDPGEPCCRNPSGDFYCSDPAVAYCAAPQGNCVTCGEEGARCCRNAAGVGYCRAPELECRDESNPSAECARTTADAGIDAGRTDAGQTDAGRTDAGMTGRDAGTDAGNCTPQGQRCGAEFAACCGSLACDFFGGEVRTCQPPAP